MKRTRQTLGWALAIVMLLAGPLFAKPSYGTLSGVVLDPVGTPQMGASVWLVSEAGNGEPVSRLLSNQSGVFYSDHLKPGNYAVRVSVSGFLPTTQHVAILANLTTLLRVQVDSIFASLDTLRRKPDSTVEPDDWKWVLRSSASTRTILQWRDGDDLNDEHLADLSPRDRSRGMVQLANGALRPGSPSSLPDSPMTAMAYERRLGATARLLVAGQMSYQLNQQGSPGGAIASIWMPAGSFDNGPVTTFVLRQAKIGPNITFQGMRLEHSERFALTDRVSLRAGAEFLRAGTQSSATAIHPHVRVDAKLADGWNAALILASNPSEVQWGHQNALQSAINELDSLSPVLFNAGRPVFEGTWHQELGVKHKLSARSSVSAAAFHDAVRHAAIFESGNDAIAGAVPDAFSSAFLYDGGRSNSWGTRLVYREKLSDNLQIVGVYAWAGAISPANAPLGLTEAFQTHNRHSLAARVTEKIQRSGTELSASYKWISGAALSRVDPFGEAAYQVDPYLHVSIRQSLPGLNGRWEALADFGNVLDQGTVSLSTQDSRLLLASILRSFRGGVSFQF